MPRVLFVLLSIALVGGGAVAETTASLRSYSPSELEEMARLLDLPRNARSFRNSTGTEVRFFSEESKRGVAINCDGERFEFDLPSRVVWMNDAREIVATLGDRGPEIEGGTEYTSAMGWTDVDLSGTYFLLAPRSPGKFVSEVTELRSIESPNVVLDSWKMSDANSRVFSSPGAVIVVGDSATDRHRIEVRQYRVASGKPELAGRSLIDKPAGDRFFAIDIDPTTGRLLFLDARDAPEQSSLHLLDPGTNALVRIGDAGAVNVFLKCDLVSAVERSRKE